MSILIILIVGAIVGWLASLLVGRREGILGSIVIGIIGAFIGSFLAQLFNSSNAYLTLSWPGIVWAFIGAVIFAAILNAVQHRSHHV